MACEFFPLTHSQKGVWSSERFYPDTGLGNIAATLRIFTDVDFVRLEKAINRFIQENDAVRLRIVEKDGEPRQYVSKYKYRSFEVYDFTKDINELYKWDEKQTLIPMEIIDSDLFYIALVKVGEKDGGLYVKFHHLIADAWTMALMGNQILENYYALKGRKRLPKIDRPSFVEYIQSEAEYKESPKFQKDREYWMEKFADWQETAALKNRKLKHDLTRARRKTMLIPLKLTAKIHEYCRQKKVSEFSLFLAAVAMYINRVMDKEDIVLGTTLLNRSNFKEKQTIGMLANIAVPLRLRIQGDMNLDSFIEIVSKEILSVFRHQKYPFDLLLKEVREKHETSVNLFDIVVTFQNSKLLKNQEFEDYVTRWHFNGHQIESLVINLNDRDNDGRLIVDYDYLTDLFYAKEIEFIHQHVINVLWHALDNPQKNIFKLEMLSEKEKQKILYKFNDTRADFPHDKTIPQLFREQVNRTPDRTAVIAGKKSLTYKELDELTDKLAGLLRRKGVTNNSVVGLMLERSLEMEIGIIGILKAGGAYLPISPDYPEDRIKYMLEDGGAKILLTAGSPPAEHFNVEVLDLADQNIYTGGQAELEFISQPTDLAYVIYTSGSTGQPKGVMNEHRALVNRLHWMQKAYPLDEDSVILQKTPFTFDVSVWELLWWSLTGAKVCMLEPQGEKKPEVIIKAIQEHRVTTMHFVPSMLGIFLKFLEGYDNREALSSLRQVFASGEALSLQQTNMFNSLLNAPYGAELYNLYGPTEAAIDVSYFNCSPQVELSSVPIGKPIDNIKLYILDKHLNLLPIGIPGELYIGGVGVARGYINKPELTQERFIPNPFDPADRLYKTGDLVRWYAEGDIEYLGRLDYQLKIRGFRIELGEIEKSLLAHPEIKETVVIGIDQADKKSLCAYYIAEREIPFRELKRFLAAGLPGYMVPSYFVRIDKFPLSANGKLDSKALPRPGVADNKVEYVPPRNEIEKELVLAFEEALSTDFQKDLTVGIDDNLFDLGGDSLTVLMIYSRIYEHDWGVTTADFYEYQTVRELAEKIAQYDPKTAPDQEEYSKNDMPVVPAGDQEVSVLEERKPQHVLLTGVTGFLGPHILSELLDNTECLVSCLIRAKDQTDAAARLKNTLSFYFGEKYNSVIGKRVFCLQGDVTTTNLGLSKDGYEALGRAVDTVIHSAAMVKYFGEYSPIEKVNVLGAQEVVDFALAYQVKLNHISTVSITGNYLVDNKKALVFSEKDFFVGQNYRDNIYVRSKFEGEKIVLNAVQNGLRASIFRMGNLTGRYSDGLFQGNIEENAFYNAFGSILQMKMISANLLREEIEFSPVDLCARAVVNILKTRQSDGRVFHIFNPHTVNIAELLGIVSGIGIDISVRSREEVEEILKNKAFRGALPGILVYLKESGELAYQSRIDIRSDFTSGYLDKTGFQWPLIDETYLSKMIGYMKEARFLSDEGVL
ncbi:MAG: amino acid adenylation domain-containing protein [Clostridia bacterium]|jgi:amino acid adenylation domain-containing protein/thioester reductase-like protein|nr:amino acid adenylation domain-containing protein [Clostridia bacterium]